MADVNYKSFVDQHDIEIDPLNWIPCPNPQDFDDILKLSNCRNVKIRDLDLTGGREDAIDIVRGDNYNLSNLGLSARKTGLTVKGSVDGVFVLDVEILEGSGPAIELGQFDDYWYPGRKPTRNVTLWSVGGPNNSRIKVRLWDSDVPSVVGSNVKIQKIPKIVWYPYFLAMYAYTKVKGLFS